MSGWPAQAITAAAQLGIADALADGPLPLDELAARVGADADALRRLMRALIGRGIFRRRRDGRYALNSLGATLRSDAPISLKGRGRCSRARRSNANAGLCWPTRSGRANQWSRRYAEGRVRLPCRDTRARRTFQPDDDEPCSDDAGCRGGQLRLRRLPHHRRRRRRAGCDAGRHSGAAAPGARGILYDLPTVVADAPDVVERNVADRVRIVGGSFFDAVPPGEIPTCSRTSSTTGLTSKSLQILRNVRAAAEPGLQCCWSRWLFARTAATARRTGWIWRCS